MLVNVGERWRNMRYYYDMGTCYFVCLVQCSHDDRWHEICIKLKPLIHNLKKASCRNSKI